MTREVFYFEQHDENDQQRTGYYFRPGVECVDGDGPFASKARP